MVTELPGGGGDKGGLAGSSVGAAPEVPVPAVGTGNTVVVPLWVGPGVTDRAGVRVGPRVGVAGPGYGRGVFVMIGPGYCDVGVGWAPGPGDCGTAVRVAVLVGGTGVRVSLAATICVGFNVTVINWFGFVVGELTPVVGEVACVCGAG